MLKYRLLLMWDSLIFLIPTKLHVQCYFWLIKQSCLISTRYCLDFNKSSLFRHVQISINMFDTCAQTRYFHF